MLKHFILIAWRNIKRKKMLSFIQLLCLSVGLAAFILVARYVQYEKNWDKFNENFENIYRVHSYQKSDRTDEWSQTPVPVAQYLKENIPSVDEAIVLGNIWNEYLGTLDGDLYFEREGYWASSKVFSVFSFQLLKGDKQNVLEAPNAIVLSESLAQKYFPGEDAMGKILLDNRKKELVVTGIMADVPEQSYINASYFRSNKSLLVAQKDNWTRCNLHIYALLKPNTSADIVSDKIKDLINQHDVNANKVMYLRPLAKLHLKQDARDERGVIVYFYSFLGITILLLSCVSFMNLSTSFSTLRSIEIGVRKAAGSGKNYIRIQFITEAIVISLLALLLGLFIARLILPVFNSVVNRDISLDLFGSWQFPVFLLSAVLVTGFLAGTYPAFVVASFNPVKVLKGKVQHKKGRVTCLQGMVYLQFVLSVLLITTSLWMYRQVSHMQSMDLGFDKNRLVRCSVPGNSNKITYNFLREQILANPGVEEMAASINSPLHSSWGCHVVPEGGDPANAVFGRWNRACPDYLKTMGLKLAMGRNFSEEFSDEQSCLINETAVRAYGWKNPIGKRVKMGKEYTVVGVLKDFNADDVHNPILPYLLLKGDVNFQYSNDLTFRIHPETQKSSMTHIKAILNNAFHDVLFEVYDYDTNNNDISISLWTNIKDTFALFAMMSILIAAFGLFGLVVFASQRRMKEIGIRKVQGAKMTEVLPLIVRQFLLLVLGANLLVYPMAKIIENITPGQFKYQFNITDLVIVLTISVVVTLVSSSYQSIKASLMNPVQALKYE
ncbi:FtsX-like permease family protein [Prolixibacteraceae bacterium JC049]|nr:FtsX-like permease family protein [Prolixibacteraceae bacterium JC049]